MSKLLDCDRVHFRTQFTQVIPQLGRVQLVFLDDRLDRYREEHDVKMFSMHGK